LKLDLNYKGNKGFRLLNIYERLNKGEFVEKEQLARGFGVTPKTIQRDISDLRAYLAETHFSDSEVAIKYDKKTNSYYLIKLEREWLTSKEAMVLCKILLGSRALNKEELNMLIDKILIQVAPLQRKHIEDIIKNEQHHYVELQHGKHLLSRIWKLSQLISKNQVTQFNYTRQDGLISKKSKSRGYNVFRVLLLSYCLYRRYTTGVSYHISYRSY